MSPVSIYPVSGLPEVSRGAALERLIVDGLTRLGMSLEAGDVVVVTQKIVSKAEGRVRSLGEVQPSARATEIGQRIGFDPRHVEVILGESVRIVREAPRVLITETPQGFVCANAGVDRSNTGGQDLLVLLPEHPDESAGRLRQGLKEITGAAAGVVISDSFGRPWREGQVNVAIGAAGVVALRDYRGDQDPAGYQLQGTELGVVDELASAAELVMGKLDRVPVALIRGAQVAGEGTVRSLLRNPATDLFR
ncbi:MAG: coenzyme F420-0:L-glutamate ligase / coenzyme F420:gamma-L-glutamate ligase [Chloroflexota bacterium]|nr:coenzyme F420-0:L-glutamate ligase / coenzyme F420:gamma-L-glutamate ligase [Chloroflexota bacterium]MEA2668980.1 coenzyme F420-0:L-glutamate ligase / coenzyme F420:gamma-L-glutamate ligase [Chloroflexota bacterium]